MIIVTPISTKQSLDPRVIDGVQRQTVPCNHFVGCAEGIEHSQRKMTKNRLEGEVRSRKLTQRMVEDVSDDLIVTMDRDVELYPTAIEEMYKYITKNVGCGAIALKFDSEVKSVYRHIVMKCTMLYRRLFLMINWGSGVECTCMDVKRTVEKNG